MGSYKKKTATQKQEEVRLQKKRELRKRWLILAGIVFGCVVIVALMVVPGLISSSGTKVLTPGKMQILNPDRYSMGDPNARVKVEEFFDFNCVHCLEYALTEEDNIVADYVNAGHVYYISYPFPFMASTSTKAAIAAECAADQNKYWEYKRTLFMNARNGYPDPYEDAALETYAARLKLDMQTFKQCYSADKHADLIQERMVYGEKNGVRGTPTFLVNGKAVSAAELEQAIQEAMGQ